MENKHLSFSAEVAETLGIESAIILQLYNQNKLDDIFSGLFWVGNKAIDLGLADGIGALKPILEEKFGKKIKIKMISQKKSFLQRRFSSSIFNSDEILNKIEERIMFSRFGL